MMNSSEFFSKHPMLETPEAFKKANEAGEWNAEAYNDALYDAEQLNPGKDYAAVLCKVAVVINAVNSADLPEDFLWDIHKHFTARQ